MTGTITVNVEEPDIDLAAVRDRYCRALDAKPGKGPITHVDWLTDSVCDIPDLLREVERLTRLLGSHTDGHRCTCTMLCGIQRDSSGAPVSPAEWEQDPWCPTHPDVDQIRAEFDRRTTQRDEYALRAEDHYLRAHDAERQRDEAETEADRLRGLLAEAEAGRDRANQRLGNLTISLNDSLAPEIVRQKAEAWDEGHRTGWEHCQDGNYGTDHWDDDTPNPYGGQP